MTGTAPLELMSNSLGAPERVSIGYHHSLRDLTDMQLAMQSHDCTVHVLNQGHACTSHRKHTAHTISAHHLGLLAKSMYSSL